MTLAEMRADFLARRKAVPSLPIAGAINYAVAAVLSLVVAPRWHNALLALAFWAIMPLAATLGRLRGEQLRGHDGNPLYDLAAAARWMVLATWAIHVPVWIYAPALFPLTVGIAFGLHWPVFGWMLGSALGAVHLALRITLVLLGWLLVPGDRMGAVAIGVAASYTFSIWQMDRFARHRALAA